MSPFLAWGDFHARSRFARSTLLSLRKNGGLLLVYRSGEYPAKDILKRKIMSSNVIHNIRKPIRSYPALKTSNHLSCKPKGTGGKVVELAHTRRFSTVSKYESFFRSCNSAREWKYTATTLRKKIRSISQREKVLTDRKILRRTLLGRVYAWNWEKALLIFNEMQYSKVYMAFIPHTFVALSLVLISRPEIRWVRRRPPSANVASTVQQTSTPNIRQRQWKG